MKLNWNLSIEGRYNNAVEILEQASKIANTNEMEEFLEVIGKEKISLEREFKKMQQILEQNQDFVNLSNTNDVMNYLTKALKMIK